MTLWAWKAGLVFSLSPASDCAQHTKKLIKAGYTPLIPALRRQRQIDLCEFQASLVYIVGFSTFRDMLRDPVSNT